MAEAKRADISTLTFEAALEELEQVVRQLESGEVPLEASANCVVVSGRRGELSRTAACLVLATDRADVNTTVRKHLDVRKISFAPMADAVR